MLKRTIFIANSMYLHLKDKQMVIESRDKQFKKTVPVEDIGFVVLENQQIIATMPLLNALNENNVVTIFCDKSHMPNAIMQPLESHSTHSETLSAQINASLPLKKQLWKKVIEMKIRNQAAVLAKFDKKNENKLYRLSKDVKSGDPENREGQAARIYWSSLFDDIEFQRERFGSQPNSFLNYGYAILRAAVARSLVGSGLLCAIGIHHHNRYNAFCLADDMIEPFRPCIDEIVYQFHKENPDQLELTTGIKKQLLNVLTIDMGFKGMKTPLMVALSRTTASLMRSFINSKNELELPELI